MLQLRNILQLVIDGLNYGLLAEKHLVRHAHQAVPHLGYHLYPINEQFMEQLLGYVTLVAYKFALNFPHEVFDLKRLSVVNISRCNHETEHFALLVDDEIHLEAKEPSHEESALHG